MPEGLTLRDYFAAQALQTAFLKAVHNLKEDGGDVSGIGWDHICASAYDAADEMLALKKHASSISPV